MEMRLTRSLGHPLLLRHGLSNEPYVAVVNRVSCEAKALVLCSSALSEGVDPVLCNTKFQESASAAEVGVLDMSTYAAHPSTARKDGYSVRAIAAWLPCSVVIFSSLRMRKMVLVSLVLFVPGRQHKWCALRQRNGWAKIVLTISLHWSYLCLHPPVCY